MDHEAQDGGRTAEREPFLKRLHPAGIARELWALAKRSPGQGLIALAFAASYLYSIYFALLGALKLFLPERVGLFLYDAGGLFVGIAGTHPSPPSDPLGYRFVPLAVLAGFLSYAVTKLIYDRLAPRFDRRPVDFTAFLLRTAGRITAIVWAGFWVYFGLASGIAEGLGPAGVLAHTAAPGLVFCIPAAVSFFRERAGGWLLILFGAAAGVFYTVMVSGSRPEWLAAVLPVISLPPVFAGVLLLRAARRTRRNPLLHTR